MGSLRSRFFIIALVVFFFGWKAYEGVAQQKLELGTDLKGGSEIIWRFDFADDVNKKELLTQALGVIQNRLDGFGLKDIVLQPIGDDRFAVQIAAKDKEKVEAIKGLITDLGLLEFRITVEPDATENYAYYWGLYQKQLENKVVNARTIRKDDIKADERGRFPFGLRWYSLSPRAKKRFSATRMAKNEDGQPEPYILCALDDHDITGESLYNVFHSRDQSGGFGWIVLFRIKKLKQGDMADLTRHEEQKYMAIILNEEVDSAPILESTLSSSGQIRGNFSEEESRKLAAILQAGALQQKPTLLSERTIAPELAGSARQKGVLSTMIGFVLVLGIMAWLYLGPGLLANLALLLNLVLLLGVLTWFEAVLTLPGIAGVVLTVGMAVDANILVFERIKEEKSKGRTVAQAISTGYDRALVTIIDSNLTTLITAYFLFQIGSGPVRGFGITLAVGIVASMFTALYVTRTLFEWLQRRQTVTEANMRGVFAPPNYPWMSFMRRAIPVSALAMVAGVVLFALTPEKKKYDLEFTKGSKLIVRFTKAMDADAVRDRIQDAAKSQPLYGDVAVRASAEGIGAEVGATRGTGFELRSQGIAEREQIDAFKRDLSDTIFKGDLLPGPLEATIRPGPTGGAVGEVYFLNDRVEAGLLKAALDQFAEENRSLQNARVKKLAQVPGAGSAFQLVFPQDEAGNESQVATIDLNFGAALENFNLEDAKTALQKTADDENSTPSQQKEAREALAALGGFTEEELTKEFFQECDPFPLADRIDPTTAQEHRNAAVRAIAFSIVGIILYVAFRFRSWSFGFAAVVALVHDVLVVLGAVAIVDWLGIVDARLNLVTVAAFLTLIGYSINDSIVVFDRIRENVGTGRARLRGIIDRSVNQTFSRTIRTTTTTWIVVLVLLVMNFGANSALEGFAFILALGVLVGTYSSIFVASPTLLYLPWLWEKTGSSVKSFFRRCVPYMVGAALLLAGFDTWQGNLDFSSDFSVPLFNALLMAIPVGILALFLLNFIRFVRLEGATGEKQA